MDKEIEVASDKNILRNLDELIREATRSSFNELLYPLLEDERDEQDDMAKRTKALATTKTKTSQSLTLLQQQQARSQKRKKLKLLYLLRKMLLMQMLSILSIC